MKKYQGVLSMEMLAVLVCMAILLSVGAYNAPSVFDSSRSSKAQNELSQIAGAVSQYHYDIGSYPDSLSKLTQKGEGSYSQYGPWMMKLNDDPWGNPYRILIGDDSFAVYSYGANKKDDGTTATAIAENDIGFVGQ